MTIRRDETWEEEHRHRVNTTSTRHTSLAADAENALTTSGQAYVPPADMVRQQRSGPTIGPRRTKEEESRWPARSTAAV